MKLKLLFCISILLFEFTSFVYSQDSVRIIILSDKVGATIERQEKDSYHLFTRFKTFQQAVFYQIGDSNYYCKVSYLDNNQIKDTTLAYSFSLINNMAARIEYFQELNSRNPIDPERKRVNLKYDSGQLIHKTVIQSAGTYAGEDTGRVIERTGKKSTRRYGYLPLNRTKFNSEYLIRNDYKFGVSVGVLYNNCKYEGLSTLFNEIEDQVPDTGYKFVKSNYEFSSPTLFRIGINFLFDEKYFGEVNTTFSYKRDREIKYTAFSINAGYLFYFGSKVRPYLSAGFQINNFSVNKVYNVTINSDNYSLESITMDGSGRAFRWNIGALIQFSPNFNINVFWSYNAAGKIKVKYFTSETKVDINSWEFGITMLVF